MRYVLSRYEDSAVKTSTGFKKVAYRLSGNGEPARCGDEPFLTQLSYSVVKRFARMTGQAVVGVPCQSSDCTNDGCLPQRPVHSACDKFADTAACRDSWRSHLQELAHQPQVHWHKCEFGLFCALVPVVWHGRCLAILKLVCPGTTTESTFEHYLETLDILVENFLSSEAKAGIRPVPPRQAGVNGRAKTSSIGQEHHQKPPTHPQVLRALDYIRAHLSEQGMTVGSIAAALGNNSSYLAHLFAGQTGQRMSRFISAQRIRLAKTFLATTDWQIKRVAYESGHANADWFSHVFHTRAGLTPGDYRRTAKNL